MKKLEIFFRDIYDLGIGYFNGECRPIVLKKLSK